MKLYLVIAIKFVEHNDGVGRVVVEHAPEVGHGAGQRHLGDDKTVLLRVALETKQSFQDLVSEYVVISFYFEQKYSFFLSIHLISSHPSIVLSIYPSIHTIIYPSKNPSKNPSYLSIYPSIHASYPSIQSSFYTSSQPGTYLCTYLLTYLYISVSVSASTFIYQIVQFIM